VGRRWRVAAIATVLLLSGQIPAAQVVRASADPVTVVTFDSEPGSFVGQGRAFTFVAPDIISASGSDQSAHVSISHDNSLEHVELSAPSAFVVGPYENTTWNGAGDPHLFITLNGIGCTGPGRFDILEVPTVDGGGLITAFAADFSIDCNSDGKLVYGQVRINSSAPIKALAVDVPNDNLNLGSGTVMVANAPVDVTVSNVGNQALTLNGVTSGGTNPGSFQPSLSCPATLDPGATCDVHVVFRPVIAGFNNGTITLGSDAVRWGKTFDVHGSATFADATNMTPATAIVIPSLPFGHAGALNPDNSSGGWIACPGDYGSLWYRYTTSVRKRVQLDPAGGSSTEVMVMAGSASVAPFACSANSPLTFTAEPGVQYWIRLQHKYDGGGGAALVLQATEGEPDTAVEASGLGVNYPTFYPYVDSYKDTVTIKGTRAEKAWVAIGIYNATGSKVRSLSVVAGTGAWAVTWNGRTSAGTALPAGKYRVVQTVTDMWGNKLSATSYTTVSWKRLYTYTYSKTLDAAAYAAYGKSGTGSISKAASSYTGGVRISTGTGGGTAAVGYAFTAPAATIYKSVTFKALGRGPMIAGGFAETGVQDWTVCTAWSVSCVSPWGPAPRAYGWAGVWASGSHHVSSGRAVRGYLHVWTFGGLTWLDARDVRITIVYGILK
jgi:hypothetical protein